MKYTNLSWFIFLFTVVNCFDLLNDYGLNALQNAFNLYNLDTEYDFNENYNSNNNNIIIDENKDVKKNLVLNNFNLLNLSTVASNIIDDDENKNNSNILNFKLINIDRKNMESNLESWIERQFNISQFNLLANIKNNYTDSNLININDINFNGKDLNISNGTIIASPSVSEPNYFFQWTRDSSLVALTVNNLLFSSNYYKNNNDSGNNNKNPFIISKNDLSSILLNFINNSFNLQRVSNWSGNWNPQDKKYNNLGEPKFNVDNSAFNFVWGRPQNDGPAIRLIAIIKILNNPNLVNYNNLNKWEIFKDVCQLDLNYIINHWDEKNFDLWEEVNSKHFYTSFSQLYSLKLSDEFLRNLKKEITNKENNDDISRLLSQVNDTYNKIWNFINEKDSFVKIKDKIIVETPQNLHNRPSGLDIAIILASLFTHPIDEFSFGFNKDVNNFNITDPLPFDANDNKVLNTLHQLIISMKKIYPINNSFLIDKLSSGLALGRYPEDIYDGIDTSEGNPWFLATLSASNLIYKLIWLSISQKENLVIPMNQLYTFNDSNETNNTNGVDDYIINPVNDTFWSKIISFDNLDNLDKFSLHGTKLNYNNLEIVYNSIAFNETMEQLFNYADSFLQIVKYHSSDEGELSEQFNKYNGFLTGASHLTWSYSEFINTKIIRDKVLEIFQL